MELPSMVQKSGGTLIVRSVVSGIPIYTEETVEDDKKNNKQPIRVHVGDNPNSYLFGEHFEELKKAQEHIMQQQQQSLAQEHQRLQAAAMELKEEGLPQCKIKRNYSCNYCTYFTQNPRYHLTHLRDVHGEKIVINKCKLCLYASRHYQKLVRHMKMVHGCTEGISGGHGQARGKRGMNREARKRKLEESAHSTGVISAMSVEAINAEHAKSDMDREHQKLQRDIEAFKRQQEEQKSQQQKFNEAIFAAAAFEQQLRVQRELDNRESFKSAAHSNYEQHPSPPVRTSAESPSQNITYDNATPAHHQHQHHSTPIQLPPQRSSVELTPSPSGSNSSPSPSLPLAPSTGQQHMDALSGGSDEPSNNRLIKCSLCEFTTLYRNLLLEHEIEDHCNAKFYRCEKCSYVTHIKARFSKHVKYHSMPMIKCVTCDFRTPYKWNLDRHMKNHGGAGPFKCAACDFTADIKQSLTVHEMNHHVPPVGHAAGMTLARRRNKVGGTDINEDFFSDSAEMLEDHFNNNNMDEYDEMLMTAGPIGVYESKRLRYDEDEPTDLSQKGGSSDTSSVHNSNLGVPRAKKPLPNLIPITKDNENILNLSADLASRSSLSDIASMFFNEKQISEMLQPIDKSDAVVATAAQLSPTTTIASSASTKSLLNRKCGTFFDKIKSASTTNENLICPCGHMAKCLSESIIHRKTCTFSPLSTNDDVDLDDDEHDEDGDEGRLEIDFTEDDECDKQSHSALNLSVSGSTRCQHCRHRCKSSADLLNHLKICSEANSRCDSLSGDSCAGSRVTMGDTGATELQHPMENRVFIWNKLPRNQQESGVASASQNFEGNRQQPNSGNSSSNAGGSLLSANNDENSYYGVETAPGYGEVTKKMTPEEEAANSSLKKVYKCPHCSFWASTASRFHVHIVGHLNKKPFECSLCSYRSNWRWDITKHIRLKTIRDPSHKNARVLMNDETGRRNYTKYNKYITLMKVTEEDGDPKLMKSGEMTPNQVASLAFINDFNNKHQGSSSTTNSNVNNILNSVREDITLEPIPPKSAVTNNVEDQLSDNFIRLPLLASMMNAAIAQQQQQQQNDNEHNAAATLITPSVTISAVKKSPPTTQNFKPNDEITLEIRHEGNEKVTNYKCRKCNFRHINRDAVLAHVKVHFSDTNQRFSIQKTGQQQAASDNNGPMQVSVNSNLYMNKVLAAMCLSQQQQQQQQHNANPNAQLSNLMAAGLLDQANSSQLSGLALALAGKSPVKVSHLNATANIIEHGEQKAGLNEASAQNTMTSPSQLTPKSPQIQQLTHATSSSSSSVTTGVGSTTSANSSSLQHLLTSPRGSFSQTPLNLNQNEVLSVKTNDTTVMGSTLLKNKSGLMAEMSPSPPSATPSAIVTTTTTPLSTPNHAYQLKQSPFSLHNSEGGLLTGDIMGGIQDHHSLVISAPLSASSDHISTSTVVNNNNNTATPLSAASSCSASLLSLSNQNYVQTENQNQNHSSSSNSNRNNLGNLSGNGVSKNNSNYNSNSNSNNGIGNGNNNNNNLLTHDTTTADRRDPSPYRCGHCHQVSNWKHVIQRHCRLKHAGVINIETLDRTVSSDRHAPPVYKPLLNGTSNDSNSNNNSNSINANSHFNLTLKALQQQQHQNHNNNHNNVLINNSNHLKNANIALKSEQQPTNNLLHSPITATSAALNAANASQDLQAAAVAYLAAAAAAVANQNNNIKAINSMTEELILQQQLQQNDQIEITRVSSSNHLNNNSNTNSNSNNNNNANTNTIVAATNSSSNSNILLPQPTTTTNSSSNLAQLLESNLNSAQLNRVSSPQNNAKSKQQKCPLCTYICDSKSQMNYHISLHKPTQYECRMCTFVCAKKQHLSSHMRTVHQMQQNQILAASSTTNANATNINMDFSLALQMASAAQNQESCNFSSPLAIDLSSPPVTRAASALSHNHQNHHHQLPPEYQYRMIYYCNKCPARYAQKHSDPLTAQKDLDEHLRQHEAHNSGNDGKRKYHCDYCDYRAMHESIIQTHRYVHTTQYQEKCNELYKNCKEDSVYRAPKLMHITATKKNHMHETIWVVDHELNEGHQQNHNQMKLHQNSIITSSSQNNSYEAGNSLLKKQLESRQVSAAPSPNEEVRNKVNQVEAEDSNTASTSASVATGDLAHDNETNRTALTPEAVGKDMSSTSINSKEKCEHCPFESSNAEEFKTHLHQHICVSQQKLAHTCEHCDYSAEEQEQIEEHTRVHFNGIEKLKNVVFFTCYDKLELSMDQQEGEEIEENSLTIKKELQNHSNNNNNEENRVNENLKGDAAADALKLTEQKQPKCAKIILYKNDGCLTIKKEVQPEIQPQIQQQQANTITENISDRLRRRISRQGGGVGCGGGTSSCNPLASNQPNATNNEEQTRTSSSTSNTCHKTILVNAKTGQVISRN